MTWMPRGRPAGDLAAWPAPIDGRPLKWAEIDVGALRANAAALRRHVGEETAVMAMVKANGYGHGAVLASRAFLDGGASWLGVSSAEEALQLRSAGIAAPILLAGWTDPSCQEALVRADVDMSVWDEEAIAAIEAAAAAAGRAARVHLKVDTGMSRLGVRAAAAGPLLAAMARSPRLDLVGVFTHFADADGVEPVFTEEQHQRFLGVVEVARDLEPSVIVHCANSATALRYPQMRHDAVRSGIALYGYAPPGATGIVELRPAMTVVACVTQVRTVLAGDSVGYGRTWTAPRDTRVATVAAGYADGLQRAQSNSGRVLISGVRCPVVGRVSMDQVGVDVSAVHGVKAGDEAVVLGSGDGGVLGAAEVADAAGTISYEVLCGISARVPRIVINER